MTVAESDTPVITTERGRPTPSVVTRGVLALIGAYQWAFAWRPSPCRFVPSCSQYALEAVERHGAVRGTRFTVARLCRCHPWGPHGEDPVPAPEGN